MAGRRELKETLVYGGQAVLEGVMMRSPQHVAVAVRRADGSIVVHKEPVTTFAQRHKWARIPFIRGTFALVETLLLGMKALNFSAEVAMEDEKAAAEADDGEKKDEGDEEDEASEEGDEGS